MNTAALTPQLVLQVAAGMVGATIFLATVAALVSTMLVPRPTRSRLTQLANWITSLVLHWIADRKSTFADRDRVLSVLGPASILVQLLVFFAALLVGLSLLVYAVSQLSFEESVYQAGSTLTTLGIVADVSPAQVIVLFISALTGLVVVAILVGYLLTLYAAFGAREAAIVKLSLLSGEPAWGPELLMRSRLLAVGNQAPLIDFDVWVDWAADVRMAHTINPLLNHFRSGNPHRHWVNSMLALLDGAALSVTTLDVVSPGALRFLAEGTQTLHLLEHNRLIHARNRVDFAGSSSQPPTLTINGPVLTAITKDAMIPHPGSTDPGIAQDEFNSACQQLQAAGLVLKADREASWREFSAIRATYAEPAFIIASWLYAARAPWSGSRNPDTPVVWPHLAVDQLPQ